jgi:hypothetical protein
MDLNLSVHHPTPLRISPFHSPCPLVTHASGRLKSPAARDMGPFLFPFLFLIPVKTQADVVLFLLIHMFLVDNYLATLLSFSGSSLASLNTTI